MGRLSSFQKTVLGVAQPLAQPLTYFQRHTIALNIALQHRRDNIHGINPVSEKSRYLLISVPFCLNKGACAWGI
jgi:hypothetical protein